MPLHQQCPAILSDVYLWCGAGIERLPKDTKLSLWVQADTYHPATPGYYEVSDNHYCPRKYQLTGSKFRYWDGEQWFNYKGGVPSVFGKHGNCHVWRGLTVNPNPSKV